MLDSFHEFKKWAESQDPNADEYVIRKNSFLGKAVTSLVRGFLPDVDGFDEDDDDDELTLDIEKEMEEEED